MSQTTSFRSVLLKINPVLCGVILTTLLFIPPLRLAEGIPAFEIVDFLLPVAGVIFIARWSEIQPKNLVYLLFFYAAFILLTMIINHRLSFVSDYFEIYKIFKFILLFCLFSFLNPATGHQLIKVLFLGLVLINLLHYFNVFHINTFLEQFYFGNKNYVEFGLNSAGLPVSKRMLGLTANPNNNAIIFCIFAIIFMPKKKPALQDLTFFGLAVIMLFLCQSRTLTFAFALVLCTYAMLNLKEYRRTVLILLVSGISILSAILITDNTAGIGTPINMTMVRNYEKKHPNLRWDDDRKEFINPTIINPDGSHSDSYLGTISYDELTEGTSMNGRYEIWKRLWLMIKQKPLFGHGPYKEFFYENKLYGENEFIFTTWRYGFLGLTIYLSIWSMLFIMALKNRRTAAGMNLILVIVLYSVASLTNLPFSSTTLNMLFAIMVGMFLAELRMNREQS